MKILVLGGTGAMGAHLVTLLAENDDTYIVVTTRRRHGHTGVVQYVQGDAKDPIFLNELLREHWDAIIDFMIYSTEEFRVRVNVLLQATSQYIFISTARVYTEGREALVEESSRLLDVTQDADYLSTDEYALTKARQEDVLADSGADNWTIIRPYITYGEERLQLGVLEKEDWLYRALRGRKIVFSADIASRMTAMTYGRDVSAGIKSVIGSPAVFGQVFHIATDKPVSWRSVLDLYLDVFEHQRGFRPEVMLVGLDEFIGCHRGKYPIIYDRIYDRAFNAGKIKKFIDVDGFRAVDEGLRACLTVFLACPEFLAIDWRTEAAKDRLTREHASLREMKGLKQKLKYIFYRYFSD